MVSPRSRGRVLSPAGGGGFLGVQDGENGSAVLSARAHDRAVRELHRKVLERVLLRSKTQSLKDAFRLYDRDRVGVLSLAQFRALMRDHDFLESDADLLIQHLDDRNQQNVSFHAFLGDIQLSAEQTYPKASPKKVQQLPQPVAATQKKNTVAPVSKARPTKNGKAAAVEVQDPMEAVRSKLRQRVMGHSKSIREVFMEHDADSSGFLDYDEFGQFMAQHKFTPEETQLVVEYLDRDGSGTIDYDEFAAGLLFYRPPIVATTHSSTTHSSTTHSSTTHSTPAPAKLRQPKKPSKDVSHHPKEQEAPQPVDVEQVLTGMRLKLDSTKQRTRRSRDFRAEFANYDVDDSSSLDHQEFGALLIGLGIKLKPHELQAVLKEIDPNDSERIEFEAFAELLGIDEVAQGPRQGQEGRHIEDSASHFDLEDLATAFDAYGPDGNGQVGYETFRRVMRESGVQDDDEIEELIHQFDAEGHGSIRLKQFAPTRRKLPLTITSKRRRKAANDSHSEKASDLPKPEKPSQAKLEHEAKARLAVLQEQELQFMEKVLRQYGSIEAAFRDFDPEQRNELDFEQFRDFMGQFGISDEASLSMLLKRMDANNSGTVDLQEFLSVFNSQRLPQTKSGGKTSIAARKSNNKRALRLRELQEKWISAALADCQSVKAAFAAVDRDENGEISHDEFRELMETFGISEEEDVAVLTRQLDVDATGSIEYEEFATIFHEGRVISTAQEVPDAVQANYRRNTVVKSMFQGESKKARAARLREIQVKWMKQVLSCHESIEAAFHQYDEDGNGELDHNEFRHFMKRYGIVKDEDIELLIRRLDVNDVGAIAFDEFSVVFNPSRLNSSSAAGDLNALMTASTDEIFDADELESVLEIERELAARMAHQTRDLRLAFRKFDLNGNGQLEYKEFRAVLKSYRLPEMEIRKVIRHLDRDVSGFIDYKEFIAGFATNKEGNGASATTGSPQKRNGKRKPVGLKPASNARRPSVKVNGNPMASSLETLKKTLLEKLLTTYGTVQTAFREYDLDKEGALNEAQFVKLVLDCDFSRDEAVRLLELFDQDQSGTVEYQEFVAQLVVKRKI
ncbi:hypothetical protein BBJ28_00000942 [Nothophytophthora sp. Chile5]|nr:hypothetical protein BBJ28_00000942 [Nothophytophthora sp. Chile5]